MAFKHGDALDDNRLPDGRRNRRPAWSRPDGHRDAGLLLIGLLGVLVWLPDHVVVAVSVVAVWLFGVVEYVNYFVVRLAYPFRSWTRTISQWRTPRLMHDINAAR